MIHSIQFQRAFKRETEVENWIQKYDHEVGEKQVCVLVDLQYNILLHTSYLPCTKMYCTRSGIFSHIQLPVFNPMNCACAVAVAWIRA